jgi:hypothetical protein
LVGPGIGRYGSVGLPDVAVKPSGVLAPIPEIQALVGLVGHPNQLYRPLRLWPGRGGWWDVYKGDFGRLRVGGQGSYTERRVFAGVGGELWPEVGDGMTG